MRIAFSALRNAARRIEHTEIRSLEGQTYIVRVLLDGQYWLLSDDNNESIRFPSLPSANELLDEAGVLTRELVHDSAYDEMVGLENSGTHTLRIPTGRDR